MVFLNVDRVDFRPHRADLLSPGFYSKPPVAAKSKRRVRTGSLTTK